MMLTGPPKTYYKLKNHSLEKGHSLGTASMCWSPPSAGSKRDAGRHQPSGGECYVGPWRHFLQSFLQGTLWEEQPLSHDPHPAASPCQGCEGAKGGNHRITRLEVTQCKAAGAHSLLELPCLGGAGWIPVAQISSNFSKVLLHAHS